MKIYLFTLLYFLVFFTAENLQAQSDSTFEKQIIINNFIIKENLLKNGKIAIIACNEKEKPLENINGTFQFGINGFKQELKFNDGIAIAPQPIDKSTFIYVRHENETGTHGKLYYVLKKDDDLNPIKVNWLFLVLIPVAILILASIINKKFILIAIIVIIALFYYNSGKGLNMETLFSTIFDGLRSAF